MIALMVAISCQTLAPSPINFTREVIEIRGHRYEATWDGHRMDIKEVKASVSKFDFDHIKNVAGWDGEETPFDYEKIRGSLYRVVNEGPPDIPKPGMLGNDDRWGWRSCGLLFFLGALSWAVIISGIIYFPWACIWATGGIMGLLLLVKILRR